MNDGEGKYYALIHPGGMGGVVRGKPEMREQDKEAAPAEGYAVVFFPKISGIGPASLDWPRIGATLARTPEAAIAKFMDGVAEGQTWETYYDGGNRVRRVRVVDLGDAERGNLPSAKPDQDGQ